MVDGKYMKEHNTDGFPLVELMIVVVIIGAIAGLGMPAIIKVQETPPHTVNCYT